MTINTQFMFDAKELRSRTLMMEADAEDKKSGDT